MFHQDDFPDLVAGDVIEVYHPPPPVPPSPPPAAAAAESTASPDTSFDAADCDSSFGKDFKPRVLLRVDQRSIYPGNKASKPVQKNTFYMDKSVAEEFGMHSFQDVIVNKVQVENNK